LISPLMDSCPNMNGHIKINNERFRNIIIFIH